MKNNDPFALLIVTVLTWGLAMPKLLFSLLFFLSFLDIFPNSLVHNLCPYHILNIQAEIHNVHCLLALIFEDRAQPKNS